MKLLPLFAFLFLQDAIIHTKKYSDPSGNYLIKYTIETKDAGIPQGHSPAPHLRAVITVFKITGTDTTVVGNPINGIYVERGCTDDTPATWVIKAKTGSRY